VSGGEVKMSAIPYCGPAPEPGALLTAWNLDPLLLAALAAVAWLLRAQPARVQLGLGLAALAYVSPLCALSAGLFSARSVHHLLIVFGAAPLLAQALRTPRVPLTAAFLLHLAVFWLWHLPSVYLWALSSDLAYWLGQAALLGSATLFWSALCKRDAFGPTVLFALFAMMMQMGLLGAILTFARFALYAPHYLTTQQYGFSPLDDQQLAGLIMWVGSLPLTIVAGWPILARLFRHLHNEATA
jgi:putative membrane protein